CTLVTVPPSISTFTLYFFCRFVFFIFLFFFFFFPYTALSRFYSLSLHDALPISIHYAATVTDKNGSILVGARPVWTTGDSSIATDRKSTRLNSSHLGISYAVFCLKKKKIG